MEYFELGQNPCVKNPIQIFGLAKDMYQLNKEEFQLLDDMMLGYYSGNPEEEIIEVVNDTCFLVSDTLKNLFGLYADISFKAIQILPKNEACTIYPLYWLGYYEPVACIHKNSEFYTNNSVKKLVLKKDCIGENHIFKVDGILENKIIVSLAVAESILRRACLGVGLKKIEVIV